MLDIVFQKNYKKEQGVKPMNKNTFISYAQDLEDLILYHVLKNEEEIFYIDVGANDSYRLSVTRSMYDMDIAHGINIDPLQACIDTYSDRKRDINICAAVGSQQENGTRMRLYSDSINSTGASLIKNKYLSQKATQEIEVPIYSLQNICERHVQKGKRGGFLKIDVEGFEEKVLDGMDFNWYRPAVITIEAEGFEILGGWEKILVDNDYVAQYHHVSNRYYIDRNRKDLIDRFLTVEELIGSYDIFLPYDRLICCKREYEESASWRVTAGLRTVKNFIVRRTHGT